MRLQVPDVLLCKFQIVIQYRFQRVVVRGRNGKRKLLFKGIIGQQCEGEQIGVTLYFGMYVFARICEAVKCFVMEQGMSQFVGTQDFL